MKLLVDKLLRGKEWTQQVRWQFARIRHPGVVARSAAFWAESRGRYAGRRAFVVGNGPSLNASDLDLLCGEVSIGSNRINLIYDQTQWRPTIVTCSDRLVWRKHCTEMCERNPQVIVTSNLSPSQCASDRVLLCKLKGPCISSPDGFSTDVVRGVFSGFTVTYVNLQIAAHMGCSPIYLIGCDHYYGSQQHSGSEQVKENIHQGEQLHFHKDYRKAGEVAYSAPVDLMNAAYAKAAVRTDQLGIRVFNATRGGHLEAFPRVEFGTLF